MKFPFKKRYYKLICLVLFLGIISIFSGAVNATTINVDNSTPNSIAAAINTASSGDIINLTSGNYYEHDIKINKSISIKGPEFKGNNKPTVMIDAQNLGRVFNISSNVLVTLNYLQIQNGNAVEDKDNNFGGGIYNQGYLVINNCIIQNSTAKNGGGVYNNYTGSLSLNVTDINNNTAIYMGGGIFNNGDMNYYNTLNLNNTNIYDNIASLGGGGIYSQYGKLTLNNTQLYNNNGRGISSMGDAWLNISNTNIFNNNVGGIVSSADSLTLINSNLYNNTASNGGAINYDGDFMAISNCTIYNNSASIAGGGIYNSGTISLINSNLYNNSAINGGAVYTAGELRFMYNNQLYNNSATNGGGVYVNVTDSSVNVNFRYCRIIGNIANKGADIYCKNGEVDAKYNWWGSNNDPKSRVYVYSGDVLVNPWYVLTVTANPTTLKNNDNSTITADLYHYSNGGVANYSLFNGIPINFNTTLGILNGPIIIVDGIANATLNSVSSGIADVSVTIDNQIVHTSVIIDTISPTASANLNNGFYNTDKNISLIMSENGTIYYTTNGTTPTTSSTKYTTTIPITSTTTLNYLAVDLAGNLSPIYTQTYTIDKTKPTTTTTPPGGLYNTNKAITLKMSEVGTIYYTTNGTTPTKSSKKYTSPITFTSTTTLKYLAVDLAGNLSPIYTQTYKIDKTAPKISTTNPTNLKTGISRTSTIIIKFSEYIKASTNFNNIAIKNLSTGKTTSITRTISQNNNTIYIKNNSKKTAYTWYQITIPTKAIKDYAGNSLIATYTFKFKTGG